MQKLRIKLSLVGMAAIVSACSFVSLNPQAQNVTVLPKATTVADCKLLGSTDVSIWSKASTFQSQQSAESQLDTLARNQAATMGGNTVMAAGEIKDGQRTYSVYNCPAH